MRKTTKYWQRNKNDKGQKRFLPPFIKESNGWQKLTQVEQIREVLPPTVVRNILDNFEDFDVWIHESDKYFTKGIYKDLKEQILKHFGSDLKIKLYEDELKDSNMTYNKLVDYCQQYFKCSISIDYKSKKIKVTQSKEEK